VKRKADEERRPLYRVGSGADTIRGLRNERPEEGTAERGARSVEEAATPERSCLWERRKKLRRLSGAACGKNTMVS